jgi:hypothetical protein
MKVLADKTWCLTDTGKRVPEGHPLARFLLVSKGSEIEQEQLESFPILEEQPAPKKIEIEIDEPPPEPEPEKPPTPKPKRAPKPKSKSPPPLQAVPKVTKVSRPRPPGTPPQKAGKRK